MKPYSRQLGSRSGVQLNQIKDNTERGVNGFADQVFAIIGRFERGRIDRAFRVNRGNRKAKLGATTSTIVSALNEAGIHVYEGLFNGGYQVVVSRLAPAAAVLKYVVVTAATTADACLSVATDLPLDYLFAVKHLECHNDGITVKVNAAEALDGEEVAIASKVVTLEVYDADGRELGVFTGSLDPAAKDESGTSFYLPNVVSSQTNAFEISVDLNASVPTDCAFYGADENGNKTVSKLLLYFDEGGTSYSNTDYDDACLRLEKSEDEFGYLVGGGSTSVPLLSRLAALGKRINTQFAFDVPGTLKPAAAIAWIKNLSLDSMYAQAYWAPLKADDPLNGGVAVLGTSAANVGMRCARNAVTDSNGVPPKNYALAGKEWPLGRTGINQLYTPDETELDDLADARINPVIFQRYNDGTKCVFFDSLTCAKTSGDRKLIATTEMATTVDDWVAKYAAECLQLPMEESISRMRKYLEKLFPALETAKWIKVSTDQSSEIFGAAFAFTVSENAARPSDRMDVSYWLHYDGTNRATHVQQTLSK